MRQLNVTIKFNITDDVENGTYDDLIDYMIDSAWDAIYGMGLEPIDRPCYEYKEVEVNADS